MNWQHRPACPIADVPLSTLWPNLRKRTGQGILSFCAVQFAANSPSFCAAWGTALLNLRVETVANISHVRFSQAQEVLSQTNQATRCALDAPLTTKQEKPLSKQQTAMLATLLQCIPSLPAQMVRVAVSQR